MDQPCSSVSSIVDDEASEHIARNATQATQAEARHSTEPHSAGRTAELLHKAISDSMDRTDIVGFLNISADLHQKARLNLLFRQLWNLGVENSKCFPKKMATLGVSGAACHIFVGMRPFKKETSYSFLTRLTIEWWSEDRRTYSWRNMFVQKTGITHLLEKGGVSLDGVTAVPESASFFKYHQHFPLSWHLQLGQNSFIGVLLYYRFENFLHNGPYPHEQDRHLYRVFEDCFMHPQQVYASCLEQCIWTMISTMPGIPDFFGLPAEYNEELLRNWFQWMTAKMFSHYVRNKQRSGDLEACCYLVDPTNIQSRMAVAWRTRSDRYWDVVLAAVQGEEVSIWRKDTIQTTPWDNKHYKTYYLHYRARSFEVNRKTMLVLQSYATPPTINTKTFKPWRILIRPFPKGSTRLMQKTPFDATS